MEPSGACAMLPCVSRSVAPPTPSLGSPRRARRACPGGCPCPCMPHVARRRLLPLQAPRPGLQPLAVVVAKALVPAESPALVPKRSRPCGVLRSLRHPSPSPFPPSRVVFPSVLDIKGLACVAKSACSVVARHREEFQFILAHAE
jgi:hypothetical protein